MKFEKRRFQLLKQFPASSRKPPHIQYQPAITSRFSSIRSKIIPAIQDKAPSAAADDQ